MLTFLRRLLVLSLLSAVAYTVWKKVTGGSGPDAVTWSTRPAPFPPAPTPPTPPTPVAAPPVAPPAPEATPEPTREPADGPISWIEPDDGSCPVSHPVKAKLASGIFHVPGGQNYDRTKADRCYADPSAAEADGLRAAKR